MLYNLIVIEKMQRSGQAVAEILDSLHNFIKPYISTESIDVYCKNYMTKLNTISGSLNYRGFPKYTCVSLNNKVCHAISSDNEILKNGDIVSVDIAINFEGFYGDSCFTYIVGETSPKKEKLVKTTYESMWAAISMIKDGICISELGKKMQETSENQGFNVVRDFCGHGIGKNMHQDPQIPFYYDSKCKYILKEGDFITIEPMVVEKDHLLKISKDGWTAITRDGGNAAQFEHTVAVLKNGYDVMTFNNFDLQNNKIKRISK